MTQMWEFSDRDFKAAIITVLHEIKVETFEMNRKIKALSRDTEYIKRTK